MYIVRLFHRDSPFEQVESRLIAAGSISIGRDPAADWQLDDPDQTLSRIHCTLSIDGNRLMLCDTSTNGTFFSNGDRAPREQAVPVEAREVLRLGGLSLLIDHAADAARAGNGDDTVVGPPLAVVPIQLPRGWPSEAERPSRAAHRDMPLLDAFCEGAGLDVSALSSEDPAQLMHRLGALYQQTIVGLSALLAERNRLKADKQLDRTTIGAVDNNPLKWAGIRRVGHELLMERDDGFLTGPDAVRSAFEDLAGHLAGSAAGASAAVEAVLALLDPEAIEEEAIQQGFSFKGRSAQAREIHLRRYSTLKNGELVSREFREAYRRVSMQDGTA